MHNLFQNEENENSQKYVKAGHKVITFLDYELWQKVKENITKKRPCREGHHKKKKTLKIITFNSNGQNPHKGNQTDKNDANKGINPDLTHT